MFLYLAPKKAGAAKKSQQKMDREKREAEAKTQEQQAHEEQIAATGGVFANMKGGDELLQKLKENPEE